MMALLSFASDGERPPTVVDLLRQDHELVKGLFREFEAAESPAKKEEIARRAIQELEIHAAVEEKVFYPAVRADSLDAADTLLESREEHHVARLLMRELSAMSADHERFEPKFLVLAEVVRHHIKEEEGELFARARTGKLDLVGLGKQLEAEKRQAAKRSDAKPARATKPRSTKTGATGPRTKQGAKKSKRRSAA